MDQFADIRPFSDSEVPSVIRRLIADDELMYAIASLKFGGRHKPFAWLLYPLIRWALKRQLKNVVSVSDFQDIIKRYMDSMVNKTTTRFTVSGLDELDASKPYLFISNHRDIALDPAFVSVALYLRNHVTVRSAIGDNLLSKPYVSDLMRINKSFIVKRSEKGPRQILAAYKLLSRYIRHSIEVDSNPVWIAQREGRAKDGVDKTEPAIIKMIAMSQNKTAESFSEFIDTLNIVPVAISYELDPCDALKASELYEKQEHGCYEKAEHEDIDSIAKGIAGDKGHVHVSFGTKISGDFSDATAVAEAIDRQIVDNYVLHPSNFFAYKMLHGEYPSGVYSDSAKPFKSVELEASESVFIRRMEAIPKAHRKYALSSYANTIDSKMVLKK